MPEQHADAALIVRERTPDDLPVAAALVEVHATDGYPVEGVAEPVAWLTSLLLLHAWVGELDGRVMGHVSISTPQPDDAAAARWASTTPTAGERVAVLGRLFVLPSVRRRALGETLMTTATGYAQQQQLRLVLDVMTKDAAAITLYERLGWQRIGATKHDDGTGQTIPAYCYVSPPHNGP